MKRILPVHLVLTACMMLVFNVGVPAQTPNQKVYTVVEQQPEYPGGNMALSHYLAVTIRIPGALLRKNYDMSSIAAKFIIDELGYVRDVRVTTKPLDKKTLKAMQGYMASIISAVEKMPRWQPGEVNRKPVAVFYTLPIEVSIH